MRYRYWCSSYSCCFQRFSDRLEWYCKRNSSWCCNLCSQLEITEQLSTLSIPDLMNLRWNAHNWTLFFPTNLTVVHLVFQYLFKNEKKRFGILTCSDCVSSALVASSRRMSFGLRMSARAMAIRCFCPPERELPLAPTTVSYACDTIPIWSGLPILLEIRDSDRRRNSAEEESFRSNA